MPVTRSKSVGNTSALTSQLGIIRILEAIFTCVAFSLVAHEGYTLRDHQNYGDWCMFAWCFCFAITLIILVVEFVGLQHRVPVSWRNFPITFAMYATLLCLSASIIFPVAYLQKAYPATREQRGYRIAATVFSCLACLAYSTEVTMTKAKPGEVTGYMATVPGLLKVVETFIACIIFVFLNRNDYEREDALKWCLAVYCICFILSLVVIILCIGECTGWLPCAFNTFLSAYTLLAVLMYATATVIWPIYHFDRKHGGTPDRYCSGSQFCEWDKHVTIAVLTALNLLVYLADLVYSARLIFIQG